MSWLRNKMTKKIFEIRREFELRSHLPPDRREEGGRECYHQAVCKAGSVVVFDGRVRHR